MGRRGLLAALAATALLGAGCGGDGEIGVTFSGSDEEQVAATVNAMTGAIAAGDGATACALMTALGQRVMLRVGRQAATEAEPVDGCETAVPAAQAAGFDPGDFRITPSDVSIDGGRAEADCAMEGAFILARTDAGWRVDMPYCSY